MNVTFRQADALDASGHPPADRREPRGGPPAAAHDRGHRPPARPASSSPSADGAVIGCAELAPLSADVAEVRSLVVDQQRAASHIGPQLVDAARRNGARRAASRRCARSRTSRRTSSASASRSCRTCGCRRRSRATAAAARSSGSCGQYAVTLPLRGGARIRPEQPAAVIYGGRAVAGPPAEHRAAAPRHPDSRRR